MWAWVQIPLLTKIFFSVPAKHFTAHTVSWTQHEADNRRLVAYKPQALLHVAIGKPSNVGWKDTVVVPVFAVVSFNPTSFGPK